MRIGIDMLAVQSPFTRHRGIGRYGRGLLGGMLALDPSNEYVFYAHEGLPLDQIPAAPNATTRIHTLNPEKGLWTFSHAVQRMLNDNPDGIDVWLGLNPWEVSYSYGPPTPPINGPRMAMVVYDLIPFQFPDLPLSTYRDLERLKLYDTILTISDSTRADCQALLGLPEGRIVNISTGGNGHFFVPDPNETASEATQTVLRKFGILEPYVFHQGSHDDRKNVWGLIDAFALLPESIRSTHQLVVSAHMPRERVEHIRRYADAQFVGHRLVMTGPVSDEELRVLYQRCAVFAFLSHYEGFGLPILEALHCGAPVVAGNNSSQIEVVGDAGLLANTHDPVDIAARLRSVLENPEFARELRGKATEQAARFSWEISGRLALDQIQDLATRGRPRRRWRADIANRPRLAVFSPFTPKRSGIATYTERLLEHLERWYALDLYHDSGYVPHVALKSSSVASFDHRVYDRRARILDYRGALYAMGNSEYHVFMEDPIIHHPGVVTLHDYSLVGLNHWRSHQPWSSRDHFQRVLEANHPEQASEVMQALPEWEKTPGRVISECVQRNIFMNRWIFENAAAVVLHSGWCLDRLRETHPEYLSRARLIPLGATAEETCLERRRHTRERHGLTDDAIVFGSFGMMSFLKLNVETVTAFRAVAERIPEAVLLFVGDAGGWTGVEDEVARLGLEDRVRFHGRATDAEFAALAEAIDIGVALRRPPTNGETSAALHDLLRWGVPTIVTDTGSFRDYPHDVVARIGWSDAEGPARLENTMLHLAMNRPAREALGRSAREYVAQQLNWERVAQLYVDVIEECYAARRSAIATSPAGAITTPIVADRRRGVPRREARSAGVHISRG